MESFSFLKYLRGGAVADNQRTGVATTTIAASAREDAGGGDVEDDASFFDLEFAAPGDDSAASDADEERVEFNFSVAGDVASGGEVVAVDAVAAPEAEGAEGKEAEPAAAATAQAPPASFLRPATKFRVLLLKLRKPKVPPPAEGNGGSPAPKANNNRLLIKFRVDDAPFVSLFTRDNSSRTSDAGAGAARPALQTTTPSSSEAMISAEEGRFAKEVMLKYLNKIKPLYVKVSRRYGDRLRFGGASEGEETDAEPEPTPSPSPSPSPAPSSQPREPAAAPAPQQVVLACGVRAPRASVPAGLKQACKRLGKSRSASSAVAAAPSPPPASTPQQPQRRDDSLLQVQDGIQSAIAHCKRSFNASKGSESPLLRSMTTEARADTKDGGDGA